MAYQKKKEDCTPTPSPEEQEKVVLASPANEEEPASPIVEPHEEVVEPPREKSGKVFLGDEDRRLLKKFNQHIVKKLGLSSSRSIKL